eukprot:s968_g7.t5
MPCAQSATIRVLKAQLEAQEQDVRKEGRPCDALAMARASAAIATLTKQRQDDMARDLNKALAANRKGLAEPADVDRSGFGETESGTAADDQDQVCQRRRRFRSECGMKPRFQGRQKEVTLLICTGRQLLEVPLKAWWRQDRIGFIFAGQGKGKVRSVRSKLAQFFNWRVMSTVLADRNMRASPRGKSSTGCWLHRGPCHWHVRHPARGMEDEVREDTMDYVGAGSGPYKRCLAADVSGTKQVAKHHHISPPYHHRHHQDYLPHRQHCDHCIAVSAIIIVHFLGYDAQYDERLGVDRLRSQAIVPIKEKEVSKVSGARYKPFEVKFVKEESELPAAFGTPEVSGRDASFHLEKRCIETVVRKDHDVASSKKSEQAATPPLAAVTKFSQLPSVATWMMRNPSKPSEKTVAEALPVPNLILTSPPERKEAEELERKIAEMEARALANDERRYREAQRTGVPCPPPRAPPARKGLETLDELAERQQALQALLRRQAACLANLARPALVLAPSDRQLQQERERRGCLQERFKVRQEREAPSLPDGAQILLPKEDRDEQSRAKVAMQSTKIVHSSEGMDWWMCSYPNEEWIDWSR